MRDAGKGTVPRSLPPASRIPHPLIYYDISTKGATSPMTITRVGATKQYSDNWENIFGGTNGRSAARKQISSAVAKSKKKAPKTKARKPAKKAARRA